MYIIKLAAYENGARPPVQSWEAEIAPDGFALLPDTIDLGVFYERNGFVLLTVDEETNTVTEMVANTEAWEAWQASLPPQVEKVPAPTTHERLNALEESSAEMSEALTMILEGVTE